MKLVYCCWSVNNISGSWPEVSLQEDKLPALMRRRLSPLGRKGLASIYNSIESIDGKAIPWVVSCRNGDAARRFELLSSLEKNEMLSPTHFSMSVHNANIGMLSIATSNKEPNTSLAGGENSFEMGLLEAIAMLKQRGGMVGYVYYDYQDVHGLSQELDQDKAIDCIAMILGDEDSNCEILVKYQDRAVKEDLIQYSILKLLDFFENDTQGFRVPVAGGAILFQRQSA